jgi:hypothetical protein
MRFILSGSAVYIMRSSGFRGVWAVRSLLEARYVVRDQVRPECTGIYLRNSFTGSQKVLKRRSSRVRLRFGVHYWICSFGISEYLGRILLLFPGSIDMIVRTNPSSSVSLDKPARTWICFLKFAASSLLAGCHQTRVRSFSPSGTRTDDLSGSAVQRIVLLSLTAPVRELIRSLRR